jgi:hypothetical protein
MNDDWRLQIDAIDDERAKPLLEKLDARELEHDLSRAFQDRVIVSRDEGTVFLYAGSRPQIERARAVVDKVIGEYGWSAAVELRRWHPESDQWEDPGEPLPRTEAEREAERGERIAAERAEVAAGADPQFEVRVDLPSHADAVRFDELLEAEGVPAVRRWKYLVVGAADEDSAGALAERLQGEAPAGSVITVEGSAKAIYEERPSNPFAIFGGLGG